MNTVRQRGVTLTGLMMWGVVIGLIAVLAMRVTPSAIEYYKLLKDIKATASAAPPTSTVPEIRKAFAKYAEIDHLDFKPEDLEITKENNQIVISFSYEKKLPLFGNVSLLIDYSGTTAGSSKD